MRAIESSTLKTSNYFPYLQMSNNLDTQTLLVLDASHPDVFVGLMQAGRWIAIEHDKAPALDSIFSLSERCLNAAELGISEVSGFIHCAGPGSMLGIRLSAMAIKTWRALAPQTSPIFLHIAQPCS